MYYRLQAPIALLSLALLAMDAIVGALGHSHAHHAAPTDAASACHRHTGCSHHHHDAPPTQPEQPSGESPSDNGPHDDCALCRHFSQPVIPVVVLLEILGSDQIEPFIPRLELGVVIAIKRTHAARGPPHFCA
jgi:hypothetical protein